MLMLGQINCQPYVYNPNNEIEDTIPDAEPDAEEKSSPDDQMLLD